jgi:hypothetical protein
VEAQQGAISSLFESMKELEAKMAEANAKKDQIIARARTAKAATKVNDMLAGVGTSSSTAAFDRMTEKVSKLEAEADVRAAPPRRPPPAGTATTALRVRFATAAVPPCRRAATLPSSRHPAAAPPTLPLPLLRRGHRGTATAPPPPCHRHCAAATATAPRPPCARLLLEACGAVRRSVCR